MSNVLIVWGASSGATVYTVYRSNAQGVRGSAIINTAATTYTDPSTLPSTTYWYGVTASNIAGESPLSNQASVTTPAIPPPQTPQTITSFTVTPASITAGQTVMAAWVTANAAQVRLNNALVAASGSQQFSPAVNTSYTLIASGSVPDISQTASVTVTAIPPVAQTITSFSVTPGSIVAGETVTIAWATANATQVRLNGVVVAASGSTTDTPAATKSYTLLVSGAAPDISQTKSVQVTQPITPQTITSFTVTPSSILAGGSATLAWTTSHATVVTLDGATVGANASNVISPMATQTYTLVASGSAPNVTQSVTLIVQPTSNQSPAWIDLTVPAPASTGSTPYYYLAAARSTTGDIWNLWGNTRISNGATPLDWTDKGLTNEGFANYENTYALSSSVDDSVLVFGGGYPAGTDAITMNGSRGRYNFTSNLYSFPSAVSLSPDGYGAPYAGVLGIYNNTIFHFGGYGPGQSTAGGVHVVSVQATPLGSQWADITASGSSPVCSVDPVAKYTMYRGGVSQTTGMLWVFDNDDALWTGVVSGATVTWTQHATTGTPPPKSLASPGQCSMTCQLYESRNKIICWVGDNRNNNDYFPVDPIGKTFAIDLTTYAWSEYATAVIPPVAVTAYSCFIYDKVRDRMILVMGDQNVGSLRLFQFTLAAGGSTVGTITAYPLPTFSGTVYGVNFNSFPYLTNSNSKHTNMTYCPDNGRLYVTGGDISPGAYGSATDGTWSVDLFATNTWRLDVGVPIFPTLPAPSAAQDRMGFFWDSVRHQFWLIPGGYFGYAHNVPQYEQGVWQFNPATNVWTNYTSLFQAGATTGSLNGGVYDLATDCVYAIADDTSGTGPVARRWSMASQTELSNLPLTNLPGRPPGNAYIWGETRMSQIGRDIYWVGYTTDGVSHTNALCMKWNIDTHLVTNLTAPPVDPALIIDLEVLTAVSHGKLVFVNITGPDGVIHAIYVYNPTTNTWATDTQTPAVGVWRANTIGQIDSARIALCGTVFDPGVYPTHLFVYQAT